jgi:nitrous oxidase accessory protein NosD
MKRRGAVLLFAVAAAVGLYGVPAGAAGSHDAHGHVLIVDKDAHHRRTCYGKHRRVFPTIQLAVNAADSGNTIKVCPGTYEETVTVGKPDLTILGANAGRDATGRWRGPESIVQGTPGKNGLGVVQLGANDITWDGFTIQGVSGALTNSPGMYTSPAFSGYLIRDTIFLENGNGIHLGASGDERTLVCRNRFTNNNEFEGPTGAFGIYSDEGARQVLITSNRFEGHNGAAVFFADEDFEQGKDAEQRDVLIEHNKSVDDRTFASIFNSTRVRLTSNRIQALLLEPFSEKDAASAIYIGARNDDIVVQKNKITSAGGNGIDITNSGEPDTVPAAPTNVTVRKNKVEHAQLSGIAVSATGAGQYRVLHNRSLTNGHNGIHFASATEGGTVTGNTALGNGTDAGSNGVDCKDESTRSTVPLNTWTGNVGLTSEPRAICSVPTVDHHPDHHDGKGDHHKKHKKHHKKTKQHRPDPCQCTLPWRF